MDRFWAKVDKQDDGCWLWTAGGNGRYGRFYFGGVNTYAHRVSYELCVGPIPDGLVIDHLCRNTMCVRPDHLEAVTQKENLRRGETIPAANSKKTTCPQGHEYDYIHPKTGGRRCRTCMNASRTRTYYRRKAEKQHG